MELIELINDTPSKIGYVRAKTKYGIVEIQKGRIKPGYFPSIISAVNKTEFFINRANEVHDFKYDYSESIYKSSQSHISIICPIHGKFEQRAQAHLLGQGCRLCKEENKRIPEIAFVDRCRELLPNIKILGKYTGQKGKILIEDENGFLYNVNPGNLYLGFKPSIQTAVDKNSLYSYNCSKVHGNKYDYSKSEYIDSYKKVTIICPEHGEFSQLALSHLRGIGCPKCGYELVRAGSIDRGGWTISNWIKAGNTSSEFSGFKVYIIKLNDQNEEFIKIGRTFRDISRRFGSSQEMPYSYEVIKIIDGDAFHMFKLEVKLKNMCKEHKYKCLKQFCGMHECFTIDCLELLKDYINKE